MAKSNGALPLTLWSEGTSLKEKEELLFKTAQEAGEKLIKMVKKARTKH